jgi:3-hydroxyacyl-CoA dehydrogenase
MMHHKLLKNQEQAKTKSYRQKEIIKTMVEINEMGTKNKKRISKTKCWYFEKINIIDKPSQTNQKKKEEDSNVKIRNEKWTITTNTNEIQRIFREYFKNLYSH